MKHSSFHLLALCLLWQIPKFYAFHVAAPTAKAKHFCKGESVICSASVQTDDDVPSMDWLTDSLEKQSKDEVDGPTVDESDMTQRNPYLEEHEGGADLGDAPIPTTGVSVAEEMDRAQKEQFFAKLVPITGLEEGVKAAQIVTTSTSDGIFEPVRYLIGLSKEDDDKDKETAADGTIHSYVLVDVPPYSEKLKEEMYEYMGPNGRLVGILVTCEECIHYDDAPSVYTIRKADVLKWEKALLEDGNHVAIVGYRMDIPRDCRESFTQILDGYGPFALDETSSPTNLTFVESGRPLTYKLWDEKVAKAVLSGTIDPPVDEISNGKDDDDERYTPGAIRAREEGKRVLAVYTPGRSNGSMCYVFPEIKLCVSGFTIPIESPRSEMDTGVDRPGPALDCRGYITTSKAGITRQMTSARRLVQNYADRFDVIFPSRTDPVYLYGSEKHRKTILLQLINDYEKIGRIYEQFGITPNDDDM